MINYYKGALNISVRTPQSRVADVVCAVRVSSGLRTSLVTGASPIGGVSNRIAALIAGGLSGRLVANGGRGVRIAGRRRDGRVSRRAGGISARCGVAGGLARAGWRRNVTRRRRDVARRRRTVTRRRHAVTGRCGVVTGRCRLVAWRRRLVVI